MFNRTNSKWSIKNFRVTILQQILNASHVDLMTQINVCKMIRQKIYVVYCNMNCSKCSNVWIWTSTVTQVSLFWHQQTDTVFFIFHVPCTVLFTVYFHAVTSVFRTSIYAVLVIDSTRKQTLLTKWFNFVFTKDLPLISQSNVQAVKAEKEE